MKLINGDCLEELSKMPDKSVDLVLTDPPYGTTSCKWDSVIPMETMWRELLRVLKPNKGILLFAQQPFSSSLIVSNMKMFKYELIWSKSKCGSPLTAKYKPLNKHESILVFGSGRITYNPQMLEGKPYKRKYTPNKINNHGYGISGVQTDNKGTRHPSTILHYPQNWRRQDQVHPTQKPVELLEWLVKSYSNEGDTVLDFTMGSGSTGVACRNLNRDFIGVELDSGYYKIAQSRINP